MNELIIIMFTVLRLAEQSTLDNVSEKAIGGYQIRPIYVRDVNRIAGTKFTHEDARDDRKAQRMIAIYLKHYGEKYEKATGKKATAVVLGMIHNGGPKGYLNTSKGALKYARRCSYFYNVWKEGER